MSAASSSFSSDKLSSVWVSQARDAASSMRRSVAGKIEYWATLGRIAEALGLAVSDAREAIALYDVCQAAPADADPLDALEADFLAAKSAGRLAQAVRQTVQSNRRQAVKAAWGALKCNPFYGCEWPRMASGAFDERVFD